MPFNISSFKGEIASRGVLKNSHYDIIITPPALLRTIINFPTGNLNTSPITRSIKMRTNTFTIPGVDTKAINLRKYGVGPNQKFPVSTEYNEVQFTVMCDRQSNIWRFWYEWSRLAFDGSAQLNPANPNAISSPPRYAAHYKDEYVTTTQIDVYDQEGRNSLTYMLEESFPMSIANVPLTWQPTNNLIQLSIMMAYKEHRIDNNSNSGIFT